MNLTKKANKNTFYFDYVKILNGVLQLSNREAEVFSYLLMADADGYSKDINNKRVRLTIGAKLGISEANLSRYLTTIKDKGLIVRGERNKWVINDNIRPVIEINDKTKKELVKIDFVINLIKVKGDEDTKITGEFTKGRGR